MVNRLPAVDDFVTLRGAIDRLFNESFVSDPFRTLWSTAGSSGTRTLPLDIYETPDAVVMLAAVPGIDPEAIEITVNQSTVTLSGQVPNAAESEDGTGATWYVHELPHGRFRRTLTLPVELDAAGAEATFQHGMLRLRLPKAERAKPRQIKVTIAGDQQPSAAIDAGAKAEAETR